MKFQQWLSRQQDREDAIGRLANALKGIDAKKYPYSRRRKPDEHRKWATIVTRLGSQMYVRSFNRAWREFLQAKARAEKQERASG